MKKNIFFILFFIGMKNNILVELVIDKIKLNIPLKDTKTYFVCLRNISMIQKNDQKISNIINDLGYLVEESKDETKINSIQEDDCIKLAEFYETFKDNTLSRNNIVLYYNKLRKNMLTEDEISHARTSSRNKILKFGVSIFSFPFFYFIFKNIEAAEKFKLQLATSFSVSLLFFFMYKYNCERIAFLKLKIVIDDINRKYESDMSSFHESDD